MENERLWMSVFTKTHKTISSWASRALLFSSYKLTVCVCMVVLWNVFHLCVTLNSPLEFQAALGEVSHTALAVLCPPDYLWGNSWVYKLNVLNCKHWCSKTPTEEWGCHKPIFNAVIMLVGYLFYYYYFSPPLTCSCSYFHCLCASLYTAVARC